jgi:MraZ protein
LEIPQQNKCSCGIVSIKSYQQNNICVVKWGKVDIYIYLSLFILSERMATFIGDYECKVVVKGRIILPMAFIKQMPVDAKDHFVLRKDIFENCLVIYSIEDWNIQLAKIRKRINPYNREHGMFIRNFFKGTAEIMMDSSNRILVPKRLMELIGAERDVVLAGQDGRIEIWDSETYNKIAMSAEDFAKLAEKLMGGSETESEI